MAGETTFSAGRRWGIFLSVVISMLAVAALVFMANYLSVLYPFRMNWSAQMNMSLSPQSLGLVRSITNDVKITIYYDREESLYPYITALLDEYRIANPKISVRTVDYKRDAGASQQLHVDYKQFISQGDTNLVIFECNRRVRALPGRYFGDFVYDEVQEGKQRNWTERLKGFKGEMVASTALLNVTSEKPFKAYYLTGHHEHRLDSDDVTGYAKLQGVLAVNNIVVTNVSNFLDTNEIPADCNLLIIGGPTSPFSTNELAKIRNYLVQGGHLFALLNTAAIRSGSTNNSGLEPLLADWGIEVGQALVRDSENTTQGGQDLIVNNFEFRHPIMKSMVNSRLQLIFPRAVGKLTNYVEGPATAHVTELAWTGDSAYIGFGTKPAGRPVPLAVAVEKSPAPGVISERGTTRMVVVGDSYFLDYQMIDNYNNNKDFAQNAINWLLDQTQVMGGVGPHPVQEYTVVMTRAQMASIKWLFLAAMPGGVLLVGLVVWWRRRR